jgi:hypothetical protein
MKYLIFVLAALMAMSLVSADVMLSYNDIEDLGIGSFDVVNLTINVYNGTGGVGNETDPIFSVSPAAGITAGDISDWDDAYSWGDHAAEGYLTEYNETDPIFNASAAAGIDAGDISDWDDAYSWGDHALAGYITDGNTNWENIYGLISNANASIDGYQVTMDDAFDLYDWFISTQSAGRLSGGKITDNANGTVTVAAGKGLIHDMRSNVTDGEECAEGTCAQISNISYVSWAEFSDVTLTDDAYNYIYYDGTDGQIKSTTDFYSVDFTNDFTVGRVYRDGNDVTIRLCGTNLWNFNRRVQLFGEEYFDVVRAKGLMLSESSLNIALTEGVLWAELVNRFEIDAYDSSVTNFTYWYSDGSGGYTTYSSDVINNLNYDDGDGTLGTLTANRYSTHYVYVVHDGSVHVVLGTGDNTLTEAENEANPSTLPGLLDAYATFVGKIIVQKSAVSAYAVLSPFVVTLSSAVSSVHNELSGLQGGTTDQYYHLTAAQQSTLTGWVAGGISTSEINITDNINVGGGFADGGITLYGSSGNAFIYGDILLGGDLLTVAATQVNGSFYPNETNTYTLGNNSLRWDGIYVNDIWLGDNTNNANIYFYDNNNYTYSKITYDNTLNSFLMESPITVTGYIYSTNYISAASNLISGGDIYTLGAGDDLWLGTLTQGSALFRAYANGKLVTQAINATTLDTGQGANELYDMNQNVLTTSAVTFATVDTGQGANELYDMNQALNTTSAVTFATVDTGQGANELYDMNQNVLTTSTVSFNQLRLGDGSDGDSLIYFYEDGSVTGESIYWDDSSDYFAVSDMLAADGEIYAANTISSAGDFYTNGAGDDLWLGTATQSSANFIAYADGDLYASGTSKLGIVNATTLDTGQGANELYDMDQNVLTTSTVTFDEIRLGGVADGDSKIYFYEDSSATGESITWSNGGDYFYFSDEVAVSGTIIGESDIYTSGAGDDLWLGTGTQSSASFRAYANGNLDIAADLNITKTAGSGSTLVTFIEMGNSSIQINSTHLCLVGTSKLCVST